MFDMLCFQTARKHLQEAERIICEIDQEDPDSSYIMLKHLKKVAEFNRKFQKYNQALSILLDVYTKERKVYKKLNNDKENSSSDNELEENKIVEQNDHANLDSDFKVEEVESIAVSKAVIIIRKSQFEIAVDSLKVNHNINCRLGTTMSQIMYIYALKHDYSKAVTFKAGAEKCLLQSVNDNKNHVIMGTFYQNVGDMYLRIEGNKNKDIGYENYDKSNKIFESVLGSQSIEYIYSTCDIGDVYIEKKQYKEAEAFYQFCKSQIEEIYGVSSIFKHRVNSSLVEIYLSLGLKDKSYECSMENIDLGIKLYGEESIFCLGFLMSGMSANIQRGSHEIAEAIVNKMLKILDSEGETKNGNQYFFLATLLLGIVSFSTGGYESAQLFFAGTLKKQLIYVDNEEDHPFLEQTYIHLATLYKTTNNLQLSLQMWKKVYNVHKRQYGENNFLLSSDNKNIGILQLNLGQVKESLETLLGAERLSKIACDELKDPEDVKDEKRQLSEIYFSLYLCYITSNDFDNAIAVNESALKINIELLGEDDLNVANNYYLGAQIYIKKLQIDEAIYYANKANTIIDSKPSKEPLLLTRYRFIRAKLYKMMEKNKEALQDADDAIKIAELNPQLYNDEVEIKNFRRNLIACFTEEEKTKLGIDDCKEEEKEHDDLEKRKMIETQIKKSYLEKSLKSQGIDPNSVNQEELLNGIVEEEEEGFLESPLAALSIFGGLLAIGAGVFYLWKKK